MSSLSISARWWSSKPNFEIFPTSDTKNLEYATSYTLYQPWSECVINVQLTVIHFTDFVPEEVLHLLPFHFERDVGDEHATFDGGLRTAASTPSAAAATPTIASWRTKNMVIGFSQSQEMGTEIITLTDLYQSSFFFLLHL